MQRQYYLKLDGVNDYGSISGLSVTGDITIECVFRLPQSLSTSQSNFILQKLRGDGTVPWSLSIASDNRLKYAAFDNVATITNFNSDQVLEIGRWYMASIVVSGSTAYMYIDGILSNSSASAGIDTNTGELIIAAAGALGSLSNYTPVEIAEIRIWNYARTSAQILNNYDKSVVGQDFTGLWVMNSLTGLDAGGLTIDTANGAELVDSPIQYEPDPRLRPPNWIPSRNYGGGSGNMQIMTGASPTTPPDPTRGALFYPTGGGPLQQWDVASQTWV